MATGASLILTGLIDKQYGFSLVSTNNIEIRIEDPSNNPVVANLTITGGSSIDGTYGPASEHPFTAIAASGITFEASASGYSTENVVSDINGLGYQIITIVLIPQTVSFTCTTTPKNSEGTTISKPISSGYLEVKFTGSTDFSISDYFVTFEAFAENANKFAGQVLDYELLDTQSDSVTYRVEVVDSEEVFCYQSNITKNQC